MGASDDDDFDLLFLDSFEEGAFALAELCASSETCWDGMKQLRNDEKKAINYLRWRDDFVVMCRSSIEGFWKRARRARLTVCFLLT